MILVIEIALIVAGLMGIFTGKLPLGKNKAVYGMPARLIGIIGLFPIPVAVVVILFIQLGRGPAAPEDIVMNVVPELVITLLFAAVFYGVGSAFSEDVAEHDRAERKRKKRLRRLEEELDEDEDLPYDKPRSSARPTSEFSEDVIDCPSCGARLKATAEMAGRKLSCPQCKHVFSAPAVTDSPNEFMTASAPRVSSSGRTLAHKKRRRVEEDDEDDEEDQYRRGPRRPKEQETSVGRWIGLLTLCVIIVLVIGAGIWFALDAKPKAIAVNAPVQNPFVIPPPAPMPPAPVPKIEAPENPPAIAAVPQPVDPEPKVTRPPPTPRPMPPIVKKAKLTFAPGTDEVKFAKYDILPLKRSTPADTSVEPTGVLGPDSELWTTLSRKMADGALTKSDLYRATGPGEPFEDKVAEGGLLVGIQYRRTSTISTLVAVYRTKQGLKTNDVFGPKGVTLANAVAPPGYAVGAINMRVDDYVRGLNLIFMKVTETGLDPNDAFRWSVMSSPNRGDAVCVSGDGDFIVGLHGRAKADGPAAAVGISAIGIVKTR